MNVKLQEADLIPGPAGLPETLTAVPSTQIMGILNVTPDSFSDGGKYDRLETALAHAEMLREQGASIIDVGGESTRPGAAPVSLDEELARVLPVVKGLAARDFVVSVDTMHAAVAAETVAAGALIINDVSGGLADPQMLPTVAGLKTSRGEAPVYIAMHWRGTSDVMDDLTNYPAGVTAGVVAELKERLAAISAAGIAPESVVLDPGFGFAKNVDQNWELMAHIEQLEALGFPLLIGASRKRFLKAVSAEVDVATAAFSQLSAQRRHWAVRVHNVQATQAALAVSQRFMAVK